MNHIILGYVRITCLAAMYCMGALIRQSSSGKRFDDDMRIYKELSDAVKILDKEADALYEE